MLLKTFAEDKGKYCSIQSMELSTWLCRYKVCYTTKFFWHNMDPRHWSIGCYEAPWTLRLRGNLPLPPLSAILPRPTRIIRNHDCIWTHRLSKVSAVQYWASSPLNELSTFLQTISYKNGYVPYKIAQEKWGIRCPLCYLCPGRYVNESSGKGISKWEVAEYIPFFKKYLNLEFEPMITLKLFLRTKNVAPPENQRNKTYCWCFIR